MPEVLHRSVTVISAKINATQHEEDRPFHNLNWTHLLVVVARSAVGSSIHTLLILKSVCCENTISIYIEEVWRNQLLLSMYLPSVSSCAICRLWLCANTLEVIASGCHRNHALHDQVAVPQCDWSESKLGQISRTGPGSHAVNREGDSRHRVGRLEWVCYFFSLSKLNCIPVWRQPSSMLWT